MVKEPKVSESKLVTKIVEIFRANALTVEDKSDTNNKSLGMMMFKKLSMDELNRDPIVGYWITIEVKSLVAIIQFNENTLTTNPMTQRPAWKTTSVPLELRFSNDREEYREINQLVKDIKKEQSKEEERVRNQLMSDVLSDSLSLVNPLVQFAEQMSKRTKEEKKSTFMEPVLLDFGIGPFEEEFLEHLAEGKEDEEEDKE